MADRTAPYPNYNYLVDLKGPYAPDALLGGFAEVTGISSEIHVADYRNGNEANPHVRKIPGTHTVGKVVCKRGVVNSADLWDWVTQTRTTGVGGARDVTITLRDETSTPVQIFKLFTAYPSKYTLAALQGKGGGEVLMEELEITAEGLEITPP
jgi:phage tail-like protein